MNKIGFLILHYKDFETTCKCIDSINELEQEDIEIGIMVVDNNSGNGSGEKLKEKYTQDNIEFIILNESCGYSKANNIGYEKMKESGYDFIVVSNNDIVYHQKDILKRLVKHFDEKPFYVCGPDVYAVYKKTHQSPITLDPPTEEEMEEMLRNERKSLKHLPIENIIHKIYKKTMHTRIYKAYRRKMDKKQPPKVERDWQHSHENVVLSGACFIVSKLFIKEAEILFKPLTQFYHEEAILTTRCRRNKWNNVYLPDLQITHLDSVATSKKKYYARKKFRYENFIASGEIYLDYLKHPEK